MAIRVRITSGFGGGVSAVQQRESRCIQTGDGAIAADAPRRGQKKRCL
jgi:hypothetical protein